jgi:hypothetical protein
VVEGGATASGIGVAWVKGRERAVARKESVSFIVVVWGRGICVVQRWSSGGVRACCNCGNGQSFMSGKKRLIEY